MTGEEAAWRGWGAAGGEQKEGDSGGSLHPKSSYHSASSRGHVLSPSIPHHFSGAPPFSKLLCKTKAEAS